MKKICMFVAGMILLPMMAAAGEPRSHIDDQLAIFKSAFNQGDSATIASLYTPDATLLPPDSERIDGRAAIQAFWQGAIDAGMKMDELQAVDVDASNEIAGEVGKFVLSVPGENGPTKVTGKYIVVWKREGHTWRLHRDIWNTP
jgi:uncharacterized protein (TIGR02246 family)